MRTVTSRNGGKYWFRALVAVSPALFHSFWWGKALHDWLMGLRWWLCINALFSWGFLHSSVRYLQRRVPSVEREGTVRTMHANSHMIGHIEGTRKKMHVIEQTRVPEPEYYWHREKKGIRFWKSSTEMNLLAFPFNLSLMTCVFNHCWSKYNHQIIHKRQRNAFKCVKHD